MENPKSPDKDDTFEFPPEWQDDNRMNVLFSPFRPKSLDSVAWESKMKFWDTLIKRHCQFYKKSSFTLSYLKKVFTRNGKVPSCLETVLEEFLRLGQITTVSDYTNYSLTADTLVTWLVKSLVHSPLDWTFKKIKTPFMTQPEPETVNYVYPSIAKNISEECLSKVPNDKKGKPMLMNNFNEIVGVKDENPLIILKPLILDNKVAVSRIDENLVIKIAKNGEKNVKISEVDLGVYQLERNEKLLQDNIERLEKQVDSAMEKIKSSLKSNRRKTALSWLRRKKELEKYIEQQLNAQDNVRALLEKLHQTESDALVLDSYRLGVKALKKSLSENGLSEKGADSTLSELEDVLDVTKEIEDCLSRPLDSSSDIDLEKELENLLADEESRPGDSPSGATFDVNSLPDVPATLDDKMEERLKSLSL